MSLATRHVLTAKAATKQLDKIGSLSGPFIDADVAMDDAPLPHLPLKLLTSYSLTGPHAAHLWNQVMALLERTRALREEVVVASRTIGRT